MKGKARQIPLSSYPSADDREAWLNCSLPWGNYTTGAPVGPHERECLTKHPGARLPGGGTVSGTFSTTGFTVGMRERAARDYKPKGGTKAAALTREETDF